MDPTLLHGLDSTLLLHGLDSPLFSISFDAISDFAGLDDYSYLEVLTEHMVKMQTAPPPPAKAPQPGGQGGQGVQGQAPAAKAPGAGGGTGQAPAPKATQGTGGGTSAPKPAQSSGDGGAAPRLQCLQQHLHPRQGGPQEMEVEPLALVEALPQQQIGVGEMASGKEHRAGSANGHGRF